MELEFATGACSLGVLMVARTGNGLRAAFLGGDAPALRTALEQRFPEDSFVSGGPECQDMLARVAAFIEDPASDLDVPLDPGGTPFQQAVWEALRRVPPGQTITYTELAEAVGAENGTRAVAQACGANPLAVIIPCHRAVRSDGGLAGFRWGVERKRMLLQREGGLPGGQLEFPIGG